MVYNKGGAELFWISQNQRRFSSLITTKCSWGSFLGGGDFSPFQFCQEENIPGHSFERRAYLTVLKAARVFPILTTRVEKEWWTLLKWLTLPPYV